MKTTIQLLFLILMLNMCCSGAQPEEQTNATAHTENWLDSLYSAEFRVDEPGIAVIIKKADQVLFYRAYGMADLEQGAPLSPEMVFGIGSATKPFTATAILMLVERGQLSLDDPISSHISGFASETGSVTLRQLLSHTSGIVDVLSTDGYWENIRNEVTLNEIVEIIKQQAQQYPPGERWSYSNSNYYLLAAIFQHVSGQKIQEFIQAEIIDPEQLSHTCFADHESIIPGRVHGYRRSAKGIQNAPWMSYSHLDAAGGIFSSVDDLGHWSEQLFNGKIINTQTLGIMLSPVELNSGEIAKFGLGWYLEELENEQVVSHGGGIFGFVCHTLYLPQQKIYVAVLNNLIDRTRSPSTKALAEYGALWAMGKPNPFAQYIYLTLSPNQLKSFTGRYRFVEGTPSNIGKVRKVMESDGHLYFGKNRVLKIELLPLAENQFLVKGMTDTLTFVNDMTGKPLRIETLKSNGVFTVLERIEN